MIGSSMPKRSWMRRSGHMVLSPPAESGRSIPRDHGQVSEFGQKSIPLNQLVNSVCVYLILTPDKAPATRSVRAVCVSAVLANAGVFGIVGAVRHDLGIPEPVLHLHLQPRAGLGQIRGDVAHADGLVEGDRPSARGLVDDAAIT